MVVSTTTPPSGGVSLGCNPVGAAPDELIVLKAHGFRNRMAKRISVSSAGDYVVEAHHGRKVTSNSHARTIVVKSLIDAVRALSGIKSDEFLIRGALKAGLPPRFRRLLHSNAVGPSAIFDSEKSFLILDLDNVPNVLPWYDPKSSDGETADAAVQELIYDFLPSEFHSAACWYAFTSSHGIAPGMNLRLFFCLDRPMTGDEGKTWLGHLSKRGLDLSLFIANQQILVAPPIILAGAPDPVRVRTGVIAGRQHRVIPPQPAALAVLAALNKGRGPSRRVRARPTSQLQAKRSLRRKGEYEQALACIGDGDEQDGIHNAILSAVGKWVRANGPDADPMPLIDDIKAQLATTMIDVAKHPPSYVNAEIDRLPQLIRDVMSMERERLVSEAKAHAVRAREPVDADRALVTASVEEAASQVSDAVSAFVSRVPKLVKRRDAMWLKSQKGSFGQKYPAVGERVPWRRRCALNVSVGVGKTQVVVRETAALLVQQPTLRVAYVVPEHKLAGEIERRFNAAAGRQVASVWRGLRQPDPNVSNATMCRRPDDADLVQRAGGELSTLCGSVERGHCLFHPFQGSGCAYVRQQQLTPQVWIVPAAMLTSAVPASMQRASVVFEKAGETHKATPPAFDMLILDEAPFLNWVGGFDQDGIRVPVEWIDQALLEAQAAGRGQRDPELERALSELRDMASALFAGAAALGEYYAERRGKDCSPDDPSFLSAANLLWQSLEGSKIAPSDTGEKLVRQLAARLSEAERVRSIRRLLLIHARILDSRAPLTSVAALHAPDGRNAVQMWWREDIHQTWCDCPVLYLDGTAQQRLAEQWLGPIDDVVTAKAAAPHMEIVQVDDRDLGHRAVIHHGHSKGSSAPGNQRTVHNLMIAATGYGGRPGLLIAPKKTVAQMNGGQLVPAGWSAATYGALRGLDGFKDVALAVVMSRQLPAPADVELMAEIVFGRPVKRIEGEWYPLKQIVRLMDDGTGRRGEVDFHPDPDAEMVRWTICEAEVLQAIGRVRAVRRDASNPVLVFVLNRVDLGDVPVSALLSWKDIERLGCPTMVMAARGCIPQMWADVAHMLGRWNDYADPAGNARAWFRDNPEEGAARCGLLETGRLENLITGEEMQFRRECLGLVGKNHRYVWLADNVTLDDARAMLGE